MSLFFGPLQHSVENMTTKMTMVVMMMTLTRDKPARHLLHMPLGNQLLELRNLNWEKLYFVHLCSPLGFDGPRSKGLQAPGLSNSLTD